MVVKIKKIVNILFIPIFLILSSINYGCSPASVLATGGGSAMVVAEGERSLGTVIDDATIKVNIAAKFLNEGNNLIVNINTSVLEGRILLTGLVDSQEISIDEETGEETELPAPVLKGGFSRSNKNKK